VAAQDSHACAPYEDEPFTSDVGAARCATLANGPVALTDVQTSGACADTLVVGAGDPAKPRWWLAGAPSSILAVHGAHYSVDEGEVLFVAQGGAKLATLASGPTCAVTWAIAR